MTDVTEFGEASTITRGRIVAVDDSGETQKLTAEGYAGERFSEVQRPQAHGFSSHPPEGAIGTFLRMGSSDRLMALGYEMPSRPRNLPPGVPALYNADGTIWKLLPNKADLDHGNKNSHERAIGKKKIEAADWFHVDSGAIYLGKPPYYPVMTSAGPSQHVFAGIAPGAPDSPQGDIG
ncbi:hypothetical protein FQV39_28770 [Bosea sp. F3-2]|uniref:phage baseplate assembly protein domain-containing protein n=1 Tax=Bosea sp. F3-2 TaxID=2599640 RepID=UPI0011F000AD|nr:phage baseplate assembly protein [Bosea sp. F3-2]QEL26158.1 hypothetical protein FQV39_28770 [Bosea sp. F3-2]